MEVVLCDAAKEARVGPGRSEAQGREGGGGWQGGGAGGGGGRRGGGVNASTRYRPPHFCLCTALNWTHIRS